MSDATAPSLATLVQVQHAAIRAIRLESDLHASGITQGYVLTSQAMVCLGRILSGLGTRYPARAWTLTGPYGSGKSYFGLFLANLLDTTQPEHGAALTALERVDATLASEVQKQYLADSKGFFPIPVTGYRAPLQECLREGLVRATQDLIAQGVPIESVTALIPDSQSGTSRALLQAFSRLLELVVAHGYRGLLLIVDELGKPLEFAAAHPEEADIYLLQEIAEFANRSGDTPLVLIGILHQAFERYAAFLDSLTQQEWAKIQGRFEDIPFQEPPAQQLHLIARAIAYDNGVCASVEPWLREQIRMAIDGGWCPPGMGADEYTALALRTYPLHPTTLVALPLVFRRLAQNERSVFAYLTSNEPNGLQEFLERHTLPAAVSLADLFDYVAANFQGRLYASGRGRILAETLDRLTSTARLSPLESALLKTVGLLTWLGETSHLQATEDALMAALHGAESGAVEVRAALQTLRQRSLLVYRRFNHSYAIWQGSDVDIEERLEQAHRRLSGMFSPAEMLRKYVPPRPLIARRHSYQTGTLRYFEVRYADIHTDFQQVLTGRGEAAGVVILCLPRTASEEQSFWEWAQSPTVQSLPDVIIGIARPTLRLFELLHELQALQWVYEQTPELRDDTVARQEWHARNNAVETLIQQHLDQTFGPHHFAESHACQWVHRGDDVSHKMAKNLTAFLSTVCDDLYRATPRIWNELLNRRTLSSQAAAARRNLIEGMLTRSHLATLGIEGFPPERSMYESLLKAGELHHESDPGQWSLAGPSSHDPLGLSPTWQAMGDFVFTPPTEIRPVQALYHLLKAPPYGITDGVLPVLLCAFYLVHRDEMTLYREGTLLPEPTIADWEVLLRRPDLFALAGCRLEGPRRAILERFARSLGTDVAVMPVVRELMRRLKTLPEHAWRTQRLPQPALQVREALEHARSPEQLLFAELPAALDLPLFADDQIPSEAVTEFFDRLNAALQALSEVTPALRAWARDEFLAACKLPSGTAGWGQFLTIAEALAGQGTHPRLQPLLQRVVHAPDAQAALDSVLALIASRPLRTWTDSDVDRFSAQAQTVGELFAAERENLESDASLTVDELVLSERLTLDLHRFLLQHYNDNPSVVRAALRRLLRKL